MKRIIKFRAWNENLKKMVYNNEDETSDYWDGVMASNVELVNSILAKDENDKAEKYEWMQFTGLTDKNGKEIYEGDIVRVVYDETFGIVKVKGVIEWDEQGNWCIDFPDKGCSLGINQMYEEIEVIGNIYENPELLT